MAEKIFIKPVGTGTWNDVNEYVMGFKFHDNGQAALDKLTVSFINNIKQTSNNPGYQAEIKWESGSTPSFAGRIEKPVSTFPTIEVLAYSYGAELLDQLIDEVFENQSPEAIAQTIIESTGELVYASTETSGITIEKISFRDKKKSEALGILADMLGWVFRTDPDKNAFFEPAGLIDSGVTLTVGTDILGKPIWDYNPDWVINRIIVEGGLQEFATTHTFAGPSNTFNLTYEPSGNVKVSELTNELIPTVEGSTETQDYSVDAENKRILTTVSRSDVTVDYGYKVPIRIEQRIATDFPDKDLKIKKKSIKSYAEARKFGREILSLRKQPQKFSKLPIYGYDSRLKTGRLTQVIDSSELDSSGNGLNESLVISALTYSYPENVFEVKVGSNEFKLFDLLKDVEERLRELEQEDSNTNIIQKYELVIDGVTVTLIHKLRPYTRDVNDSWIWGSSTWGSGTWGDRCDGDNFTSYASGNYTLSDHWSGTGSYQIGDNKLDMDSSAKVTYIGRDGTNEFPVNTGKVILTSEKNTATNLKIYLREQNANNSFIIDLDYSSGSIHLKKKDSGSELAFKSGSFTFANTNSFNIVFSTNTFRVYSGTTNILGSSTFSLDSGSFSMESIGGNSKIQQVEIFTGV